MLASVKNNSAPMVMVKRLINADRQRVFDAWTKPELMHHWYVGAKGISNSTVDLRVGGKYTNDMIIDEPDGSKKSYYHHGEYLEITPPERLVFTFNSPFVEDTKVIVELREVGKATEVSITHYLNAESECQSHHGGWTFALGALDAFVG